MIERTQINEMITVAGKGVATTVCCVDASPYETIGVYAGAAVITGFKGHPLHVHIASDKGGLMALLTVQEALVFARELSQLAVLVGAKDSGEALQ